MAGLARSLAAYVPEGLDYCALAAALITTRESGRTGFAPVLAGHAATLGVETPVYDGGVTPATATSRRRAFIGWIGESLTPNVVLEQALEGHPNVAVTFRYDSRLSHVAFTRGSAPTDAQRTTIALEVGAEAGLTGREGWTVQSFGAGVVRGVFGTWNSLALFSPGGTLLSVVLGLLVLGPRGRAACELGRWLARRPANYPRRTVNFPIRLCTTRLTGLPNRALVLDRAKQMLARVAREPDALVGALYVDIDFFKHVNEHNLGHAAGDRLLRVVGKQLQSAARDQEARWVVSAETSSWCWLKRKPAMRRSISWPIA